MSVEQMQSLVRAAMADSTIAAAFAGAATSADVVDIATSLGYDVTIEDVEAIGSEAASVEMSDAELAGVAGGGSPSLDPMLCPTGHCQSMYGLGCA